MATVYISEYEWAALDYAFEEVSGRLEGNEDHEYLTTSQVHFAQVPNLKKKYYNSPTVWIKQQEWDAILFFKHEIMGEVLDGQDEEERNTHVGNLNYLTEKYKKSLSQAQHKKKFDPNSKANKSLVAEMLQKAKDMGL